MERQLTSLRYSSSSVKGLPRRLRFRRRSSPDSSCSKLHAPHELQHTGSLRRGCKGSLLEAGYTVAAHIQDPVHVDWRCEHAACAAAGWRALPTGGWRDRSALQAPTTRGCGSGGTHRAAKDPISGRSPPQRPHAAPHRRTVLDGGRDAFDLVRGQGQLREPASALLAAAATHAYDLGAPLSTGMDLMALKDSTAQQTVSWGWVQASHQECLAWASC